jgi:hypothetical protein
MKIIVGSYYKTSNGKIAKVTEAYANVSDESQKSKRFYLGFVYDGKNQSIRWSEDGRQCNGVADFDLQSHIGDITDYLVDAFTKMKKDIEFLSKKLENSKPMQARLERQGSYRPWWKW